VEAHVHHSTLPRRSEHTRCCTPSCSDDVQQATMHQHLASAWGQPALQTRLGRAAGSPVAKQASARSSFAPQHSKMFTCNE